MNSRVWLLLVVCSLLSGWCRAEGFAVVKGQLEGKSGLTEMQLMVVDNGVPVKYAGTTIASCGSFAFMFEPQEEDFYYLYDGKEYYRLFIGDGDEVSLKLLDDDWQLAGECREENRLLEQWRSRERCLKVRTREDAYGDFFPRFDSVRREAVVWLDTIRTVQGGFAEKLRGIVELDLLNDFISYIGKHQQFYESEEQQSDYYHQVIKHFPTENEALLYQPYGMDLLRKYFIYKHSFIIRQGEYGLDRRLAEIRSPLLKAEYILAEVDTGSFERFCAYEEHYFPMMQNDNQRYRLTQFKRRPHSSLKVGERASNFIYPDTTGRFRSMADFRGKNIYIDLWATWCAPCKAEIPNLQQLEAEYAGKGIEFVSISIDKNRAKWKDFVRTQHLGGVQLWAGDWTNLPEELHVGSIPRFILIDREGNWVDTNAPRPSDPALKTSLKKVLKK